MFDDPERLPGEDKPAAFLRIRNGMEADGSLFTLSPGTQIQIIDRNAKVVHFRILEGPRKGTEGWSAPMGIYED